MKVSLPPSLYRNVLLTTLLLLAFALIPGWIFGGLSFVLAAAILSFAGLFALYSLAKKIIALFSGTKTFLQLAFIFRLACFAILLYLVLVRFNLSPVGAIVGISLPLVASILVLLFSKIGVE